MAPHLGEVPVHGHSGAREVLSAGRGVSFVGRPVHGRRGVVAALGEEEGQTHGEVMHGCLQNHPTMDSEARCRHCSYLEDPGTAPVGETIYAERFEPAGSGPPRPISRQCATVSSRCTATWKGARSPVPSGPTGPRCRRSSGPSGAISLACSTLPSTTSGVERDRHQLRWCCARRLTGTPPDSGYVGETGQALAAHPAHLACAPPLRDLEGLDGAAVCDHQSIAADAGYHRHPVDPAVVALERERA